MKNILVLLTLNKDDKNKSYEKITILNNLITPIIHLMFINEIYS